MRDESKRADPPERAGRFTPDDEPEPRGLDERDEPGRPSPRPEGRPEGRGEEGREGIGPF